MGLYQALDLLVSEWDGIRPELSDDTLAELGELVTRLATEPVPDYAVEFVEQIALLIRTSLPVDHPFRGALRGSEKRWSPSVTHNVGELTALLVTSEALLGRVVPDHPLPTSEDVRQGASAWLLAEKAFSAMEIRERGQDPEDPEREDGIRQWPAFQFDRNGRPLALVRQVNQILDVTDDPWGVADWWLGGNVWLRGVPANLIGQVDDQALVDAALSERAEG